MRVAVLGAGVSGLTCAIRLVEAGHGVRIVARAVPPHTTSSVAPAFWYPYNAAPDHRVAGWARDAYATFCRLRALPDTGITLRPGVEVLLETRERPSWSAAIPSFRAARDDELPAGFAHGWAFDCPVIDARLYLPWLLDRVCSLGVTIDQRNLASVADVPSDTDVVVNCTGLGAREVAPDPGVHPIRGQLVHVADPGLDRVIIDETRRGEIAYVIPRGDDCVLGGTHEPHVDGGAADPDMARTIIERCAALEPRLAGATPLSTAVGLRPGRTEIRLDAETRDGRSVIHNYGHGGAGITLSWGCAAEVTQLVEELAADLAKDSAPRS